MPESAKFWSRKKRAASKAFSGEADAGSRRENASRQELRCYPVESGVEFSRKNDISFGRKRDKMTVGGKTL
jgi:hypothetical protein